MTKMSDKLAGVAAGLLSGLLASEIFGQAWKLAAGEDSAPSATDPRRSWREVLIAAAMQGAIFAVVKAAVDRWATAAAQGRPGRPAR